MDMTTSEIKQKNMLTALGSGDLHLQKDDLLCVQFNTKSSCIEGKILWQARHLGSLVTST